MVNSIASTTPLQAYSARESSLRNIDQKIKGVGRVISGLGMGVCFSLSLIYTGLAYGETDLISVGIYLFIPFYFTFSGAAIYGLMLLKKRESIVQASEDC